MKLIVVRVIGSSALLRPGLIVDQTRLVGGPGGTVRTYSCYVAEPNQNIKSLVIAYFHHMMRYADSSSMQNLNG